MLNNLPEELTLLILGCLVQWQSSELGIGPLSLDKSGLKALASICRSCKHLERLATPLLYRQYDKVGSPTSDNSRSVSDDGASQIEKKNVVKPNVSLLRFLRTLVERPDLAYHVKHISLARWDTIDSLSSSGSKAEPCSAEEARRYYVAISHILLGTVSQDWVTTWLYCLSEGLEDAEVALLVALCPNVEILELETPTCEGNGPKLFLRWVMQSALRSRLHTLSFDSMHTFACLKRLRLFNQTVQDDAGFAILRTLPECLMVPKLVISQHWPGV